MYKIVFLDIWFISPNSTRSPKFFYVYPEIGGSDITGQDSVPGDPNIVVLESVITEEQLSVFISDSNYGEESILILEELPNEEIQ